MSRASMNGDPVLVAGEPGLDLSAVARAIHEHSRRAARAIASVDCAAYDAAELEQEIFGGGTPGGTLILEDLDELPAPLQTRLARALRDGQIEAGVSGGAVAFDVRIIATVHGDADQDVRNGKLRRELCARFPLRLEVPPLRQRPGDIPLLIGCLVAESAPGPRPWPRQGSSAYAAFDLT